MTGDHRNVSASFSHDGQRVVTATIDHVAVLWDAASGSALNEKGILLFQGHQGEVMSAVFSSDDTRIVTASYDGTARVWNAADGEVLSVLVGNDKWLVDAAISNDGNRILTTSDAGPCRLWFRRRPEWWWGIAWLPEFWIASFSGSALLFIAARNIRRRFGSPSAVPAQQPVADSQ